MAGTSPAMTNEMHYDSALAQECGNSKLAGLELAHRRRDGVERRRLVAVEFEFLDSRRALLDPAGRGRDVDEVLVGLAEVALQLADALAQEPHVLHHVADLGADQIGRLA